VLNVPIKDRKKRMRKMRRSVQRNDVYRWLSVFFRAAIEKELHDFPILPEYIPSD
jgi:trehalose 6-phosphate synthase